MRIERTDSFPQDDKGFPQVNEEFSTGIPQSYEVFHRFVIVFHRTTKSFPQDDRSFPQVYESFPQGKSYKPLQTLQLLINLWKTLITNSSDTLYYHEQPVEK